MKLKHELFNLSDREYAEIIADIAEVFTKKFKTDKDVVDFLKSKNYQGYKHDLLLYSAGLLLGELEAIRNPEVASNDYRITTFHVEVLEKAGRDVLIQIVLKDLQTAKERMKEVKDRSVV